MLRFSAECTVEDEHAARREQANVVGYGRSRNRVDNDIYAAILRQLPDAVCDFFDRSVDAVIGAKTADDLCFFLAADHADNDQTCQLRKVDQGIAHPARSGMDEQALPLLRSHRMV